MDYHQDTKSSLDRMYRNVARKDFVLEKDKAVECLMKIYDLFKLPRPKKVIWYVDIFNSNFQEVIGSAVSAVSARSARSARSAASAWSAGSAVSAWSALDYDFDWYVFEFEYCKNPDKNNLPNENDGKYLEYCELLMQAKEYGMGYRVEYEDTLYCVPTPLVLIDERNNFHSTQAPAIRWKGGREFYYLHGVNFEKELWKKVVSGKMPFAEILALENIDQRVQAMRFGDVEQFLSHTNAVKLDECCKELPNGKPVLYRLFRIPKGDVFTEDAYYAVYDCPSTFRKYMSGVPNTCKTVSQAMAWKMSCDECVVTPKEWLTMAPLVDES